MKPQPFQNPHYNKPQRPGTR